MLITRECDYAVRIVRALAGGEKLCVNQICEKEDLTPAFVYKILKKLEKKEIVKSCFHALQLVIMMRSSSAIHSLKRYR